MAMWWYISGNKKPEGGDLDAPGEEKILRSGDSPEIEEQGIVGAGKISFPYLLNFQKETT